MSQDNKQNDRQNRQGQGDNWQGESSQGQSQGQRDDWQGEQRQGDQGSDDMTRESRSSGYSESESNQGGTTRGTQSSPELGDTDEMDEDRDDDDRQDGSPNRRNNIG
jgi:hypothetical protein